MIFDFLDAHQIAYQRVDHPPVSTCEEAREHVSPQLGAETKNLFLRDGKGKRHFLVSVAAATSVDLKSLARTLDVSGLSFASADRLKRFLGLEAGSVTLLGVLNDAAKAVEVVVDERLWAAEKILCHPLVNTSTLVIRELMSLDFLSLPVTRRVSFPYLLQTVRVEQAQNERDLS